MRRLLCLAVLGALLVPGAPPAGAALVGDPTTYVDPLIGTGGDGFTVPGATTPFGMTTLSPDTLNPLAYSGYKYEDAVVTGFSLIHVNGPGVNMGGDLPFLPVTTPVLDPANVVGIPFTHVTERAHPGSYGITLGNGVAVELAATAHGGLQSFTPPPGLPMTLLADVGRNKAGLNQSTVRVVGSRGLEGSVLVHWRGGDYTVSFSAVFSAPFTQARTFVGSASSTATSARGTGAGALLTFPAKVTMAVGVSFVDLAGARRNRQAELPAFDVARTQSAARASWRRELNRIRVGGGTTSQRRTFYTALYRVMLNPDVDSDVDGRYRGADDRVHTSRRKHYENFSLWDTIRGENALLATLFPERYRDMMASLAAFARESGALPRWALHSTHPDYMNGDPAIATLAEAVCRDIADDPQALYAQARHLAFDLRPQDYLRKGYVGGSASDTLEFANADFALALMARKLGHNADAALLTRRSTAWRHLLHDGFLQPRKSDGSWPAGYDPTAGDGYREGTGWQYLWLAPHDQAGLVTAYGDFTSRLDHFFSAALNLPGSPVVPAVQSAETAFGTSYRGDQYVPGNEHDLEAPYSYNWTSTPSTGQAVLSAERSLFLDNPEGMPGNDDLGSLSAWYVWSALGFYPSVSGAPMMVMGTPLFSHVEISLGAKPFVLDAPGGGPYIASAALNARPLNRTWFPASQLRAGGRLDLRLQGTPSTWGSRVSDHPPSVSTSSLSAFGC